MHELTVQNNTKEINKTVTTKELADTLRVSVETIRQTARRLIEPSKSIWRVINGGKSQVFNESQATAIKIELQNHSHEVKNQEKSENMNLGEKNTTLYERAELRNKDKEQNMMTPNEPWVLVTGWLLNG